MYRTIAVFVMVIMLIFGGGIYAYVSVTNSVLPDAESITVETEPEETGYIGTKRTTEKSNIIPARGKIENVYTNKDEYIYDQPFYGMDEEDVEKTRLGKADKIDVDVDVYDDGFTVISKTYYWFNSDGTYRAYAITGADIHDWDRRMVYSFRDCNKKSYYSSGKSSGKSDPYNAKDYGYEEDFYDDYYDDFYDFEDAEDYWMEHNLLG